MRGDGVFSLRSPEFSEFLSVMGNDDELLPAFAARNFLLDEGVVDSRYDSYEESGCVADHGDFAEWVVRHAADLTEKIQIVRSDHGGFDPLDPGDPDVFPETFRFIGASSPFLRSDVGMDLVRVEKVASIANRSGWRADDILSLAEKVIATRDSDTESQQRLDACLEQWALASDACPVFAGYWAEVADLFGGTPEDDTPDWADELRNRLGLAHHNPDRLSGKPIRIIVFRYPVRGIPRLLCADRKKRPLVPPTVLDSAFSAAFCPAPRGCLTGYAVHCDGERGGVEPCREVLHPAMKFEAEHVWRVGEIRTSVTDSMLREAKEWHLMCVRDICKRPSYAM